MKRHDFIVGTMVKSGFRASLKGFSQFCRCVELYLDDRVATIDSIYGAVSNDFGCSKSAVEKNIRRLISSTDACGAVGTLFGADFNDVSNKEIVALFANYVAMSYDGLSIKKSAYTTAV